MINLLRYLPFVIIVGGVLLFSGCSTVVESNTYKSPIEQVGIVKNNDGQVRSIREIGKVSEIILIIVGISSISIYLSSVMVCKSKSRSTKVSRESFINLYIAV